MKIKSRLFKNIYWYSIQLMILLTNITRKQTFTFSIFFTLLILTFSQQSQAQNNMEISWQACYGTEWPDNAYFIVSTEDGYLILGEIYYDITQGGNADSDLLVFRIDTLGNIIWKKTFGGSGIEYPSGIISDNMGNYYISAWTFSNDGDIQSGNHGNYDRWILKIDGQGNIIWEQCYGGSRVEYGGRIQLLRNGNIITYGATQSFDGDVPINYGGLLDNWIMIITPEGEIVQSRVYGNEGQNNIFDLVETRDGGFFFASKAEQVEGMVEGYFHGASDVWAVKLTPDMDIEWQQLYGGSGYDYGYRGVLELEDGYIFLGLTESNDGDVFGLHTIPGEDLKDDIWVVRIDTIGNILWQKCLGGFDWDNSNGGLYPTQDGGFIVVAETMSEDGDVEGMHYLWYITQSPRYDIWMVKLSSEGVLEWSQCYGSYVGDRPAYNVIQKADDNWIIAATVTTFSTDDSLKRADVQCEGHGTYDFWLFNLKDCSHYQPATPQTPTGPDTLCHTNDSTSVYTLAPAAGAWGFTWQLQPSEAGTLEQDSLTATITWNTGYQGEVQISAASYNDCGESAFSEVKTTFVYTCVGVEENTANGFGLRVYPNPAKEWVTFEIPGLSPSPSGRVGVGSKPATIFIYNHTGQLVEQFELTNMRTNWNAGRLPRGLYFYRAEQDGKTVVGKLVLLNLTGL